MIARLLTIFSLSIPGRVLGRSQEVSRTLLLHDGLSETQTGLATRFPAFQVASIADQTLILRETAGAERPLYDTVVIAAEQRRFPVEEPLVRGYQSIEQEVVAGAMAAQRRMTGGLSVKRILEFFDSQETGLLVFVTDSAVHEKLVSELGFGLAAKTGFQTGDASLEMPIHFPEILGMDRAKSASVRGWSSGAGRGALVPQPKNVRVFPVIGDQVGCLQARNGARACVVIGSVHDFPLLDELLAWINGDRLWLEVQHFSHRKTDGQTATQPTSSVKPVSMYTVTDEIEVTLVLGPQANLPDLAVQLELVMMQDAYYRVPMKIAADSASHTYMATIKLPDTQGVYQLQAVVRQLGFNDIVDRASDRIIVRTFRHDDYPRFLLRGLPWYAAVFASLAGSGVFVLLFALELKQQAHVAKQQ